MGLLSILTGTSPKRSEFRGANGVTLLQIDATMSVVPTHNAEISEHPVEEGPDIGDHIRLKNGEVQLDGEVSETPITLGASLAGLAAGAGAALGGKVGGPLGGTLGAVAGGLGASLFGSAENKAEKAHDLLMGIYNARKTFTLVDANRSYKSMVITQLTFPRKPETGKKLEFTCRMKQMRIVTSKVVKLSSLDKAILKAAAEKEDLGKQAAENPDGTRKTFAATLYDGMVK